MYSVIYSDDARHSIAKYKKSNPASFRKVMRLDGDLRSHPKTGIGKPEALKMGRRKRLLSRDKQEGPPCEIYEEDMAVYVISVEGHYGDK